MNLLFPSGRNEAGLCDKVFHAFNVRLDPVWTMRELLVEPDVNCAMNLSAAVKIVLRAPRAKQINGTQRIGHAIENAAIEFETMNGFVEL